MRTLVESLKRLYIQHKVTREHIDEMYQNGKLTTDEYWYILENIQSRSGERSAEYILGQNT